MSIVLARIDNRLIHGQVLEAWVPHVHANCIVVANDAIGRQNIQKCLMAAAVPSSIRLVIGTLAEVAALFAGGELVREKVLLLFANSADALAAHRLGIPLRELNLGNMHAGAGTQRYSCTIALDSHDVENLHQLDAAGVRIVSCCIPSDHPCEWKKLAQLGVK